MTHLGRTVGGGFAVAVAVAVASALVGLQAVRPAASGPQRTSHTESHGAPWPGAGTTGVPPGTRLSAYGDDCLVTTPGARIDSVRATCAIIVRAPKVLITSSELSRVEVGPAPASVTVEDSIIDSGTWVGATVGDHDFTLRRVEVRGGQHSVMCSARCTVEDSWLHSQSLPAGQARHNNAFISNGGYDMTVRHSTLSCDPPNNAVDGGCTADLALFGDFAPVERVRVEDNLFRATPGGYCASFGYNPQKPFGSIPSAITVSDNVFQRGGGKRTCGFYGAVTSFLSTSRGSAWVANRWDDGSLLTP